MREIGKPLTWGKNGLDSRNRNAHFHRAYRPAPVVWLVSGHWESGLLGVSDLGKGIVGLDTIKPGIIGKIFGRGLELEEGKLSE